MYLLRLSFSFTLIGLFCRPFKQQMYLKCTNQRLRSSLQNAYGRHHELVDRKEISICLMSMDLVLFMKIYFLFPLHVWPTRLLPGLTLDNTHVLYETGTSYLSRDTWDHPRCLVKYILRHWFSFQCCVCYIFCLSSFRVLCPMLHVSLDFPLGFL